MVFGLFKDGDELFDEAVELVKQREYEKAERTFQKCIDKESARSNEARLMITFIQLGRNLNNSQQYNNLATQLKNIGNETFEFGLSTFETKKLINECEAMAVAINARSLSSSGNDQLINKGNQLIEAAKVLQTKVGPEILSINEFYNGNSIAGMKLALALMAEGNECISNGTFWSDPRKAAEYQQIAFNFRRQLGESGDENQRRMLMYSKSCTCWICGRIATGEGMHFYRMSSDLSPQTEKSNDIADALDVSTESIFVCRACYSAFSKRADEISKGYYNASINEIRAAESRLNQRIAYLESRINSLSMNR